MFSYKRTQLNMSTCMLLHYLVGTFVKSEDDNISDSQTVDENDDSGDDTNINLDVGKTVSKIDVEINVPDENNTKYETIIPKDTETKVDGLNGEKTTKMEPIKETKTSSSYLNKFDDKE
jgi:hypothetical protein